MTKFSILELNSWRTPASDYPRVQHGKLKIEDYFWTPGDTYEAYQLSPLGDPKKYDFIRPTKRLRTTVLRIDGKVWMVDDPPHWWAMQDHSQNFRGNILIAGLGLGLILHALRQNLEVKRILVVERDKDVIDFIRPLVPDSIEIVQRDWYKFKTKDHFDGIFYDLFVGDGRKLIPQAMREAISLSERFPNAETYKIHGFDNNMIAAFLKQYKSGSPSTNITCQRTDRDARITPTN